MLGGIVLVNLSLSFLENLSFGRTACRTCGGDRVSRDHHCATVGNLCGDVRSKVLVALFCGSCCDGGSTGCVQRARVWKTVFFSISGVGTQWIEFYWDGAWICGHPLARMVNVF